MSVANQRWAKARRWISRWFVVTIRESLSPIFNRQEIFSVLSLPIFLFLVATWLGSTEATQEFKVWWAGKMALTLTLPAYLLINALRAPFLIAKEERELGAWSGFKFIFHEPKHIRTIQLTKGETEHKALIKIPYCEPFSSVHVKWEVDDMGDPSSAAVGPFPEVENIPIDRMLSRSGECLTWTDGSRAVTLIARSSGTGRASVRVYLLDWYLEGKAARHLREPTNGK